ncbi:MAG: STAS domain-containing protein [Acidimicrobiales bacterium]
MNPSGSLVVGRFLGTVIVTLHGDLDLAASVGLAGVLRDLIDGQGNLAVVVDLGNVCRIDGSGVDVLASAADRIATRGGELRLGGPTGAAFDALALAGLGWLISIPFEQAPRAPSPGRRSGGASRRAATIPHPAGSGRYRREEKGDTS